jgi:5'-phosphate synthase pdxT subunit
MNTNGDRPTIGVLALQGDVREHRQALEAAGAATTEVRTLDGLNAVDGLVIPGGESTTVGMLLERYGLMEPLRNRIEAGMPIFGTCTGMILLAREIEGSPQPRLGTMDLAVRRNAYGRQVDSFESHIDAPILGADPLPAVFIRAPSIIAQSPKVETLAQCDGSPVLVRQGHMLAAAFHPELTDDRRVHELFVRMVKEK